MIDFSKANEEFNFYGGSEKKKTIIYKGISIPLIYLFTDIYINFFIW